MKEIKVRPIGFIRQGTIIVDGKWSKGLAGIEGYSHLLVFCWLDKTHKPDLLVKPKGPGKFPAIGFLATRTPHRPNPIGFTVVKLLKRTGNKLWVKGLDAWDGTAILDLKPYTKREAVGRHRMPGWVKKLDKLEKDPLRRYAT